MSIPLQDKCAFCKKNKVTSHHRLCDKCWGKRAKEKDIESKKLLIKYTPSYTKQKNNLKKQWNEAQSN